MKEDKRKRLLRIGCLIMAALMMFSVLGSVLYMLLA